MHPSTHCPDSKAPVTVAEGQEKGERMEKEAMAMVRAAEAAWATEGGGMEAAARRRRPARSSGCLGIPVHQTRMQIHPSRTADGSMRHRHHSGCCTAHRRRIGTSILGLHSARPESAEVAVTSAVAGRVATAAVAVVRAAVGAAMG